MSKKALPGLVLSVTLPNGKTVTRTTNRLYTHVCFVKWTGLQDVENTTTTGKETYNVVWSQSLRGAENASRAAHNSPNVKRGWFKVETQIINVPSPFKGGTL